jgi:hypothetical protein
VLKTAFCRTLQSKGVPGILGEAYILHFMLHFRNQPRTILEILDTIFSIFEASLILDQIKTTPVATWKMFSCSRGKSTILAYKTPKCVWSTAPSANANYFSKKKDTWATVLDE